MKKISIILIALGLILISVWGGIKLFGDNIVSEVKKNSAEVIEVPDTQNLKQVAPETPTVEVRRYTVSISNKGGEEEMDACRGGFTEMTGYPELGEHRLLSAHNNCGGDVVLPMVTGDHVIIEGDQEYAITEIRDTPKHDVTTDVMKDMNGIIFLQSCYYNDNHMKFVALTPVN